MAKANLLDSVISIPEQASWIDSPLFLDGLPSRPPPVLADDPYDDRLQLLLGSPEWPAFAPFLRGYIENGLPKPFDTQPRANSIGWWNITVGNKAARVHINVNRQYAVTVNFRADAMGGPKGFGAFWIDKETAEREQARGITLPDGFSIEQTTLKGYERDVVALNFRDSTPGDIADLFNSTWMLRAVRTLNLDLMRGGRLQFGWQRFHTPKLVDAIFAGGAEEFHPAIDDTGPRDDDAQTGEETEIQRLVWLRKNQTKFSYPVKRFWQGKCAVTGIEAEKLLQACHIKPFSESNDTERLDEYNGLCLSAHIHAAFDAHLIGFAPNGEVCFSDRLSQEDRRRMCLKEGTKIEVSDRHRPYIEHRYARFLAANPAVGSSD